MKHSDVVKLYKYRAYNETSIQMLRDAEIWLAKPGSFNDPFDCSLIPGKEKTTLDLREQIFQIIDDLYSDEEATKQKNEILENTRNKPVEIINDPSVTEHIENSKNMGVYSLSEKNNHILMWSHYADNHKGFCLEFHRDNDPLNLLNHNMCEPVKYKSTYPDLHRKSDLWSVNLYTKAAEWEYEAEWRLVMKEGGKKVVFPAPLTGVIFGMKMEDAHKEVIRQSVPSFFDVKYYQAERVKGKFAIEINEI